MHSFAVSPLAGAGDEGAGTAGSQGGDIMLGIAPAFALAFLGIVSGNVDDLWQAARGSCGVS